MSERKKNMYVIWVDRGAADDEPEVVVDEFVTVEPDAFEDEDRVGMIVPRNEVRTVKNRPIYEHLMLITCR